ncbi:MAG: nicotinate phosphoribosyltransferase [Firmicutes bacterium]|nr:nicotinate phosphoribosyltransferase [Bacillota bacterium]
MKNNKIDMDKLTDLYEFTMSQVDFNEGNLEEENYFEVFYRSNMDQGGYSIAGGLEEIIDFVENFHFSKEDIAYLRSLNKFSEAFLNYLSKLKFTGSIEAVPDGTVIFPNEPILKIKANKIEAKLIETDLLVRFNHGSLITTRARRIVDEAKGRPVLEFGARRAHNKEAAIVGAKYAYIGGCVGTSCYGTGFRYGVPILGTMAHCLIQELGEYEAFLAYAKTYPEDCVLLVDTIDTLKSGVPNAIRVAKEFLIPNGYRLKGIRLDSGDLAYLSIEARKLLDEAGLTDATICASNSLTEYLIRDLLEQGAKLDTFGVGENLITSKNSPVFGGVYKLAATQVENHMEPRIKLSNNVGKVTNPGMKNVYRLYDKATKKAIGDVLTLDTETIGENGYTMITGDTELDYQKLTNYEVRKLHVPIFKDGELVYQKPTAQESREYCEREVNTVANETRRIVNPTPYPVSLSKDLLMLKRKMILDGKAKAQNQAETKGKTKAYGII